MMQLDKGTWMRFAIWMVIGTLIFCPAKKYYLSYFFVFGKELMSLPHVSIQFVGFFIYFSYGIRNSAEARLTRLDTFRPACTIKGEPMATEKEAFIHNTQNATRDDDDEES